MVRKIGGKCSSSQQTHLKQNNTNISNKTDIANTFSDTFRRNSSSEHYSQKFQKLKNHQERQKLNFTSPNDECYNSLFSMDELKKSLQQSHDTATGPDQIHYQFLKHLPESSLLALLHIFNTIFQTGKFPKSWKEATIVPIPKPGKDNTDPLNYRPIALTSCLCKTMERMVNSRLTWFLQSNNIITPLQSGFQ